MSRFFLDITDSQIALLGESSFVQSPGAVLAKGHDANAQNLAFGQAIFEELKRRPLETRTDFWAQLSTVSLNTHFAGARHSADLVYEHLKCVFAEAARGLGPVTNLSIIAPSNVSQAQLELLLGILNALDKTPTAILDRALLHHCILGKSGVHLDLQWRQLVATEVDLERGQLAVGKSTTIPGNGYLDLLEQCLEHCADMCVEQTRFDPRRSAEAEQLLFNSIPAALATLTRNEEAALSVSGYEFKVSRSGLEFVGNRLMAAVTGTSGVVSVDSLLTSLPGVRYDSTADQTELIRVAEAVISERDASSPLSRISTAKVADTLASTSDISESEEKIGITDAPLDAQPKTSEPTHILINSEAFSILDQSTQAQSFGLVANGHDIQVADEYRNQVSVLSTESTYEKLRTGCRLYRNDGTEALLIRVEK